MLLGLFVFYLTKDFFLTLFFILLLFYQIGYLSSAVQTPLMDFILNDLDGNFDPVNTACIFLPLLGAGVPICSMLFVRKQKKLKTASACSTPALPEIQRSDSAMSDVEMDALTLHDDLPHPDHW